MLPQGRQHAWRLLKFKPIKDGIEARLPEAFKKFRRELLDTPKPVHYLVEEGKWKRDSITGLVTPVQNVPILTMFPLEMNNVMLGGEMVIRGFQKRAPRKRRVPKFWVPSLQRTVVYSEVLNKYYSVVATQRLILQIHEYKGLDDYLLENLACDLRTSIALKLKKNILTALLNKNLPYDEQKNNELYEKYKKHIIPKEELEWYGLRLSEAIRKQKELEEAERIKYTPLKHQFRLQLLQELREAATEDAEKPPEKQESGWLTKIKKPFTSTPQS